MLIDLMRKKGRQGVPRNAGRALVHAQHLLNGTLDPAPDYQLGIRLLCTYLEDWANSDDIVGVTVILRPTPEAYQHQTVNTLWFHVDDATRISDTPRVVFHSHPAQDLQDPFPPANTLIWAHVVCRRRTESEGSINIDTPDTPDYRDDHRLVWINSQGERSSQRLDWGRDWWIDDVSAPESNPSHFDTSVRIHPYAYDPVASSEEAQAYLERHVLNRPRNEALRVLEQHMQWAEREMFNALGIPADMLEGSHTYTEAASSRWQSRFRDLLGSGRPTVAEAGASWLRRQREEPSRGRRLFGLDDD